MDMTKVLAFFCTIVFLVIFFGLPFYLFRRFFTKRMTKTQSKIGANNALTYGACLLALVLMIAMSASFLFDISFMGASMWGFYGAFFIAFLWQAFGWITASLSAGPVLLDCGLTRANSQFRILALLALLVTVTSFAGVFFSNRIEGVRRVVPLFWSLMTVYFFAASRMRLQLRRSGILQLGWLLRWEKIESYYWEGEFTANNLVIRQKFWFGLPYTGVILVPDDLKEKFDGILKEYVSASARVGKADDEN